MIRKSSRRDSHHKTLRRFCSSKNTFARPKSTTRTTSGMQSANQLPNNQNTGKRTSMTRVTNLTTKRTTITTIEEANTENVRAITKIEASTENVREITKIEGSTEREKAETITIRTEEAITGIIMRKSKETITEERRNILGKRRKIVVIIDEMYGEDVLF